MKFDRVLPNLWLGPDLREDADIAALKAAGVTAILSLQTEEDRGDRGIAWERDAAAAAEVNFCHISVKDFDSADLQRRLPNCVAALDELLKAGHVVYLHCTAGVSRSPTTAAAYLHRHQGWTVENAQAHLRKVRNCSPNGDVIRNAKWTIKR